MSLTLRGLEALAAELDGVGQGVLAVAAEHAVELRDAVEGRAAGMAEGLDDLAAEVARVVPLRLRAGERRLHALDGVEGCGFRFRGGFLHQRAGILDDGLEAGVLAFHGSLLPL